MQFTISKGVDLTLAGAPDQSVVDKPVTAAALLGVDYPGLRPALAVAEGDTVQVGQVLFTDRARPGVSFVSPLSGRIAAIEHGPRRSLSALVIRRATENPEEAPAEAPINTAKAETLREALLERGLWPAFRSRPFGRIPAPEVQPQAIFVTATDSEPLAPDPMALLAARDTDFRRGTGLLTLLTAGPVYVCQPPGPPLADETARVRIARFTGPHPAGLAGTHINALHPPASGTEVWSIDCQDVAAIGHLAETGRYDPTRIVALSGSRATQPRLLRTVIGASIRDLTANEEAGAGPVRVLSGSQLSGRDAAWLGRYHRQITMFSAAPRLPHWAAMGWRWAGGTPGARPIIPTTALERALPAGFLPVPLIRALAVGDADAAERLGALDLIEEDMALLSALCTSGADYGALLRQVLNTLAEAA